MASVDHAALDARRESIWRRLLEIDDELADLERAEQRGIKSLDAVTQEIIGRLKRQRKQYERACYVKAQIVFLAKSPLQDTDEIAFGVDKVGLNEFTEYVRECAKEWTDVIVKGFDDEVKKVLLPKFPMMPPVAAVTKAPSNRVAIHDVLPEKPLFLPSTSELILRFWGANKDTSVLPATVLGLGYFAIVTWTEPIAKIFASVGTVLVFPFLYALGRLVAQKERRRLVREAQDAHEAALLKFVKDEISETLLEHEESLTRWIHTRNTAWKKTLTQFNEEAFLETTKKRFLDKRRDLVIQKKRLEETDRELQQRQMGEAE